MSSDCEYTEVACVYESLGCGVRMLRKDNTTHKYQAREKHMDLSLVVKLLTVEQKTLTAAAKISEEKHMSHEKSIALKDKQHKSLTEEHNKLLKKNETLTMKLTMLSGKHETLSKKHETLQEQYKTLSDTVSLLKEQYKLLTRKEKVLFKLPHYASKKMYNVELSCAPFYSHPGGYKMCIEVDANGYGVGNGTHVSVFTKVLAGDYDNQLHWPFLGTVTYELLN